MHFTYIRTGSRRVVTIAQVVRWKFYSFWPLSTPPVDCVNTYRAEFVVTCYEIVFITSRNRITICTSKLYLMLLFDMVYLLLISMLDCVGVWWFACYRQSGIMSFNFEKFIKRKQLRRQLLQLWWLCWLLEVVSILKWK